MKIVVFNAKGGSGKTTLATTLAVLLDSPLEDLDDSQVSVKILAKRKGWEPKGPHLVVDTPGEISPALINAVASADLVLIPVMVGATDFIVLPQSVKFVKAHARGKVAFVGSAANVRAGDGATLAARLQAYEGMLGWPLIGHLSDVVAYKRAGASGQIAPEIHKKAADECAALVSKIQEIFK